MRRPLRFLIEHLGLDEPQVAVVSRALQDLKIEREQAQLDERRSTARLADLMDADQVDGAAVAQALDERVAAAQRQKEAIRVAFERLFAALRRDQRKQVATLLRSGPFGLW